MKKFIKKCNRGLILGGVITLGLIIYVVIDNISFGREKDIITQKVNTYIEEYMELLEKKDYKGLEACIDENWSDETISSEHLMYSKDMMISLTDAIAKQKGKCDISDAQIAVKNVKVSKAGPEMAKLFVEFAITANVKEVDMALFPYGECYASFRVNDSEGGKTKFESTYNVYMIKQEGEWIFTEADGYTDWYVMEGEVEEIWE